jgi:predicted dienelactone hydrolase
LAQAGFAVASVTHSKDNNRLDPQVQANTPFAAVFTSRVSDLAQVIDFLLSTWPEHRVIDADRIGAYGYSAGGLTVLAAAGAVPDFQQLLPYCANHREEKLCAMPLRAVGAPPMARDWVASKRIGAVVAAAPGMPFMLTPAAVTHLRVPVQLWFGEADTMVGGAENAAALARSFPIRSEFQIARGAGHYDFLPPCTKDSELCRSAEGFDRAGLHQTMNKAILDFFQRKLKVAAAAP